MRPTLTSSSHRILHVVVTLRKLQQVSAPSTLPRVARVGLEFLLTRSAPGPGRAAGSRTLRPTRAVLPENTIQGKRLIEGNFRENHISEEALA